MNIDLQAVDEAAINNAPFRVDDTGFMWCDNLYARGNIEASSLKANVAMIKSAHIGNLVVQTIDIAAQAVTVPLKTAFGSSSPGGSWTTIGTLVVANTGAPSHISFDATFRRGAEVRALRNGTQLILARPDIPAGAEEISWYFQYSSSIRATATYVIQARNTDVVGGTIVYLETLR